MKSFVELFETILSGDKESSRLAAREVRKLVYGPYTGKYDEIKSIVDGASEEYRKITDDFRQENFVMAVSVMYFLHDREKEPDFLFSWLFHLLKHPNGYIRHAAVRMLETELGSLTVHLRCPDSNYSHKFSRAEADQILANMFIALVSMENNFWEPRYKKYKYISSLPSGPYKSIQMVLSELEDDCGEQFMNKLYQKLKIEK
ncbi:MAG: hypothetical protein M0P97_01890 [Candidatus Moranbacteria bacterium]|jgi:hypothetical protein|nr:hypothetical protein [Candidatus Moranbacteria bacterium]